LAPREMPGREGFTEAGRQSAGESRVLSRKFGRKRTCSITYSEEGACFQKRP